jgi:hypothetical protein
MGDDDPARPLMDLSPQDLRTALHFFAELPRDFAELKIIQQLELDVRAMTVCPHVPRPRRHSGFEQLKESACVPFHILTW